jgi:LPXTG-site transpeptidase (sortase) family protein
MIMKITPTRALNCVGITLVVIGLAVVLSATWIRHTNASVQAQPLFTSDNSSQTVVPDKTAIQGVPTGMSIPSLGIQNDVAQGVFDKHSGKWTLTLDKVQYAVMTNQPNDQRGLTFMYGHNRKGVFARLPAIQAGAVAQVTTDNNHTFYYRFTGSKTVTPQDTSIFAYNGSPILVLQTCTGAFFQNRQLFTFELIGVDDV